MPSSPTWQEQLRQHFQITQSFSNSSQLSIPPEIMSSNTVHAAGLCTTAQRPPKATEMHGKWEETHNHAHSSLKRTQGVAPTAQTPEETTLLMLIWLGECGLVEGSESRDFGSHWTAVIRSVGRHNNEFMETKVTWDMHRPDLTQKTHQLSNKWLWQSHSKGEESLTLTLGKDHNHFYLCNTLFDKTCHRGLILKINRLKRNHNLGFPMRLSHPNHSYK